MSEEKKYVTFRDLRAVAPAQKTADLPTSATSPSIPSTSSIGNSPSTTPASDPPNSSEPALLDKAVIATPAAAIRLPSTSSSSSISSNASTSSTTRETGTVTQKDTSYEKPKKLSAAPERDFQRVPNSITRAAIPSGLFRGKSKQVWDYLWSVTRGAVVPLRTTRKSRREIKVGSGLGSMVTVDAALEHLERVGLITVKPAVGSFAGNEYEVFTPDEASTSISSITSTSSSSRITQKVDELDVLDSGTSSTTQFIENTSSYDRPNTSFKTKDISTDDDDAFAEFAATVRKTAKEITGKEPSKVEAARWAEVAEVLMTELKIAAGRTTVSNVPAFLAEHLRRRLWKKEKRQIEAEAAEQKVSAPPGKVDASQCPNCFGTGMYYPEGFDKGVSRCPHSKLLAESKE